jgi:hypothetical protein
MDAMMPQEQMAQALVPQPKPVTHDVTIITTKKFSQAKVMGVPPEEFGIERGARTIKDSNYCFHETPQSVGSLIEQGYDPDQIKGIASSTNAPSTEDLSRDTVDEEAQQADSLNEMARFVRVTEHYIRMDYEGKGKPCIYKVTTAGEGGEILRKSSGADDEKKATYKDDIERVDVYPFAAAIPVPQPHRFFGRSIAEIVMDIQRIKTALVRGMLDNLYLHNNPRVEVAEAHAGPNTLDDLLVSRPGGVVRTKTAGGLNWQVVPDITGSVYPALQYLDATREMRTGMTNQSQGIDADALQNQTATSVAQVFSASQMRTKLIARILAEGVRDMFALLHGAIRKHGQQQQTVRLRNTWVPVDPRNWKTRDDMTINVGLGTGGKAQQFAQVMALANVQKEMIAGGKVNLVDDKALFNTASELTKIMGYKNPDKFFNDPAAKDPNTGQPLHPPVPPPEDPKVTAMKLKAQADQQANAQKAEIEKLQAEADIITQRMKTEADIALAKEKAELEARLAVMEHQFKLKEHELKVQELQHKMSAQQQIHEHKVKESEMGLVAGAMTHDQKMEQSEQSHEAKMAAAKVKPKAGK